MPFLTWGFCYVCLISQSKYYQFFGFISSVTCFIGKFGWVFYYPSLGMVYTLCLSISLHILGHGYVSVY